MYSLHFRDELDEPVARELDALIARLKALLSVSFNEDGSLKAEAISNTLNVTNNNTFNEEHWWRKGPWTFDDPNGADPNVVGLLPPKIPTGTYNDYNPAGMDNSVILEVEPDGGDVTLTGLKAPAPYRKRMVLLRNRDSANSLFLTHASASSDLINRFDLPNSDDIELAPHQNTWLYYDIYRNAWTTAITGEAAGGLSSTVGGGDVFGPGSATDDHIATFDGATGKLIQDSGTSITALSAGAKMYVSAGSMGDLTTIASSPITIAAAPAANEIIVPHEFYFYQVMGTATFSLNPNLRVRYNGLATPQLFNDHVASNIANRYMVFWNQLLPGNAGANVDPRGRAIELYGTADATYNAGTKGTFYYAISYSIMTLG